MRIGRDWIMFRCDLEYWQACYAGDKTAEVRLLDRDEFREVCRVNPKVIELETDQDPDGAGALAFNISYWHEIGELVGKHLVIFCWRS